MIEPSTPHLVLVGLPGSGKTTVGRAVAARLGRPFIDFDEEIERREGRTVTAIFAESGEPYFRELEIGLSRELAGTGGSVLAPGGGWAAIPGAMEILRPPARVIYLAVSPETALRRVAGEAHKRPLVEGSGALMAMRGLLAAREPFYRLADHVIDVELVSPQSVTASVISLAAEAGEG